MSAASAISWPTTWISLARSPASRVGREHEIGDHRQASGRPPARARTWKLVRSWPVAALIEPPARLDRLDDVARRALAGALENHVLQQVRPARARLVLPARAAAGDDARGPGSRSRRPDRRRRATPLARAWTLGHASSRRVTGGELRGRKAFDRLDVRRQAVEAARRQTPPAARRRRRGGVTPVAAAAPPRGTWPDGRWRGRPAGVAADRPGRSGGGGQADGGVRIDQFAGLVQVGEDGARRWPLR